jgi:hypothetical protein
MALCDFKPIKGKRAEIEKKVEQRLPLIFNSASIHTKFITLGAIHRPQGANFDDFWRFFHI